MKINEQIIKKFSQKFNASQENLSTKYVFIGGTALMLLSLESDFEEIRGTRDYDIVLLVKETEGNKELFEKIWEYIDEGRYDVFQSKEGVPQYYRFINPQNKNEYPEQLEFFSNSPEFMNGRKERFTPLHADDDVQSLSSIIMDEVYYNFILSQCKVIQNVNSVTELGLIVLKAKAYNDLLEKKKSDNKVSSKNIDKHKKDVIRVLEFIHPDNKCDLESFPMIQNDIALFINNLEANYTDEETIKVGSSIKTNLEEVRISLRNHFYLE